MAVTHDMSITMDNNLAVDLGFFDLIVETYKTAPKKLFIGVMNKVTNVIDEQSIELEKHIFQLEHMNNIPVADLDEFYDNTLDTIDNIKLLRKRLKELNLEDIFFKKFDEALEKAYTLLVLYMDRMGQLEVRLMTYREQQSA